MVKPAVLPRSHEPSPELVQSTQLPPFPPRQDLGVFLQFPRTPRETKRTTAESAVASPCPKAQKRDEFESTRKELELADMVNSFGDPLELAEIADFAFNEGRTYHNMSAFKSSKRPRARSGPATWPVLMVERQ
eukprot:2664756-Prymnesium_polylepis.1